MPYMGRAGRLGTTKNSLHFFVRVGGRATRWNTTNHPHKTSQQVPLISSRISYTILILLWMLQGLVHLFYVSF